MADGEGSEGDHEEGTTTTATCFSQLLFADDDVVSLDMGQSFYFNTTTSTEKPPKMLCFGSHENEDELVINTTFDGASATKKSSTPQKSKTTTKSRVTCTATDSSSASSGNNGRTTVTTLSKSSRKRNGSDQEPVRVTAKPAIGLRSSKVKTESPTSTGLKKVRREKLGERVSTLQHLVSPFGKTDTASVLHEAKGYIKFLQDQVQVLCSPYLQRHQPEGGEKGEEESRKDLSSRGLCLVPVAYTVHVASSNGADFWSSSVGNQ